ncbi:MAG: tRNA uridine 5-carboxymethylaminomethyl modification enzyme MnmG [Bacteroidetes bacterium ADurb.Bin408]|nr:MAG: tRNA uridine 5-carboxymethylaminomethyl modification enzyme MnmG [Bacteroidetes bacterium ADurb.Bin408]
MLPEYDIIVAGAGHAGCEAAAAAARLGSSVLLITSNMFTFAQMSCNPSMGGIAKGQIVREIDALGGLSGIVTDHSMIQFRMLNRSKGPAMWSPRAQADRILFTINWRLALEKIPHLDFWQDTVTGVTTTTGKVSGVTTLLGLHIKCKALILTNGTFLNEIIHIGEKQFKSGRVGEAGVTGLTESLNALGLESDRMKTGTSMRVDGRSLDYSKMEEQKGDENPGKFSFTDTPVLSKQKSCYITHTNKEVHDILRTGFEKSPLFKGIIEGIGPRYCPSIEDKIVRFHEKDTHLIFVEPEGWETAEVYINGFSSSLPEDVQYRALKKMKGFENVKIFRPGYAIEYDFFPPLQLQHTLETNTVENLYLAGQINGTTGYEEAACQGLIAGINAHRKLTGNAPFILKRSEAYIGVLIDDLVTKGVDEPYRMFTSRAEFRILLRQDNADLRLTPFGYELGLIDEARFKKIKEKENKSKYLIHFLRNTTAEPSEINDYLTRMNTPKITQKIKLYNILLRPQLNLKDLISNINSLNQYISDSDTFSSDVLEQSEIMVKYESYIEKEMEQVNKMERLENIELHPNFDYQKLKSLSYEAREKLSKIKPRTIGQASRISGVSPSDISVILIYLGR